MIADADGRVRVTGALTFATVSARLKDSTPLFAATAAVLRPVGGHGRGQRGVGAAGQWLRLGRERGVQVEFAALPASLRSLADVSDLGDVAPLLGAP